MDLGFGGNFLGNHIHEHVARGVNEKLLGEAEDKARL
jgi:chromosome segregation ATPase